MGCLKLELINKNPDESQAGMDIYHSVILQHKLSSSLPVILSLYQDRNRLKLMTSETLETMKYENRGEIVLEL